jgi:hypothetical protein
LYLFVYGQCLWHIDPDAAERRFLSALARNPKLALAESALVSLYAGQQRRQLSKEHARRLVKLCPSSPNSLKLALSVQDSPIEGGRIAARLREVIRNSFRQDVYYLSLWQEETRLYPAERQHEVRARIGEDAWALERRAAINDPTWWSILLEAYRRSWDLPGRRNARERQIRALGRTPQGLWATVQKFLDEHPFDRKDRQRWARERFAATAEWTRYWPDEIGAWTERATSMVSSSNGTLKDLEEIVSNLRRLRANERSLGPGNRESGIYARVSVAVCCQQRRWLPAWIEELLREAIADAELIEDKRRIQNSRERAEKLLYQFQNERSTSPS